MIICSHACMIDDEIKYVIHKIVIVVVVVVQAYLKEYYCDITYSDRVANLRLSWGPALGLF